MLKRQMFDMLVKSTKTITLCEGFKGIEFNFSKINILILGLI